MKSIFVSQKISKTIKKDLKSLGEVIQIHPHSIVYESINHHPDIYLFCSNEKIYMAKEQYEQIKSVEKIDLLPIEVLENQLGYEYPNSVVFNGLLVGDYFIHNLKYTANSILNEMKKQKRELIHVNQGYTRCSALPIDPQSIITSDKGIAKAAAKEHIEVCLIQPGFILLPGQAYGFIGGTAGRIGDSIYFAGDITKHPDYDKIRRFIEKRKIEIKYDSSMPLTDLGSILVYEKKTRI